MLEVNQLEKYYGDHLGLDKLSFTLKPGSIIGILGPNGSGKTTLFRMLLGLIPPTSGEIRIPNQKRQSLYFGYLPEERSVYRDISVLEQITYLGRLKKIDKDKLKRDINNWLIRFDLIDQQHKLIKQLSKGNQQKVQFICALLHNPQILILDEPLTGLDAQNVSLFKAIIFEQAQRGKSILLSSHQYEEIETFCNEIILLRKGKVVLKGNLKQLKQEDGRINVIIDQDLELQYRHLGGVLSAKREGNFSIYTFVDRPSAKLLTRYCSSSTLRLEPIGLRNLVEECA